MDLGDRRRLIVSLTEDGTTVVRDVYRDYVTTVAGAAADSGLDSPALIAAVSAMARGLEAATEAVRRQP